MNLSSKFDKIRYYLIYRSNFEKNFSGLTADWANAYLFEITGNFNNRFCQNRQF